MDSCVYSLFFINLENTGDDYCKGAIVTGVTHIRRRERER